MNRDIIYNKFIKKFNRPHLMYVGVELEFPLINSANQPVDEQVCHGLMTHLLKNHGFNVDLVDSLGNPVFVKNNQGDVLSFDNSYNNFEFSMDKSNDLYAVSRSFYRYLDIVQEYLQAHNHTLVGRGTNPNKRYITKSPVLFQTYNTIAKYLEQNVSLQTHKYPDFPAYLSSIQTHLDVSLDKLPLAFTLFGKLDFVRAILFSNSPAFEGEKGMNKTVCFRDYLWENSGFGLLSDNVGKVDKTFFTIDNIIDDFEGKSLFCKVTDGQYQLTQPHLIKDATCDLSGYLSFKNIELTSRGTLEVRSDCAQPLDEAFVPAAFNVGIMGNLTAAEKILDEYFKDNNINKSNTQLRNDVIYNDKLPADFNSTSKLAIDLIQLAHDYLKSRGKGEEMLIIPLFERGEALISPAKKLLYSIAK